MAAVRHAPSFTAAEQFCVGLTISASISTLLSMTPQIKLPDIALYGPAGCGKDTVAKILHRHFGYQRIAFADPVRQALLALDPLIPMDDGMVVRLSDVVDLLGWEDAKREHEEVRILLQRFGTDSIRTLDPNFWVDIATNQVSWTDAPVVFTDTRFENEVEMVRDLEGVVVKVERNVSAIATHRSESSLADALPDYTLHNDGTLDELEDQVWALMAKVEWY